MNRSIGYVALIAAGGLGLVAWAVGHSGDITTGVPLEVWTVTAASVLAVLAGSYGLYRLVTSAVLARTVSKRRQHDVRNVLRLAFVLVAFLGVFAVITDRWIGVLFSLGIIGFAITFALQQPLFSLIGWFYIMVKRPYGVGDRVAIEDAKGDVISVDFFVTTLWEIDGHLVSSHQPSGRIITVPNSVVLSSHVYNYSWEGFPYVWNEVSFQVSYETDLSFAVEQMKTQADAVVGEEMATRVAQYRERLEETPVELEVNDRPSVNIVQTESWVDLRLRYVVHPKRGQRVKNELHREVLTAFNEHPDRIKFPLGRNR